MKFAENVAIGMGYSELRLCINVHMHENQRFYANLGFAETTRKRVSGYDRIYYRKELIAEQDA